MILVYGNASDGHVRKVIECVERRGADIALLDLSHSLPSQAGYAVGLDHLAAMEETAGRGIDAVWWRPKRALAEMTKPTFAAREWLFFAESLQSFVPPDRWMNSRPVDQAARSKPLQLEMAIASGLTVPPTIVTNDPSLVEEFLEQHGPEIVYKCLSYYYDEGGKTLFTSSITRDALPELRQSIIQAPGIFQQRIAKSYELRITVVGDDVFSVKIESQKHERTQIDWRVDPGALEHAAYTLPEGLLEKIKLFHGRMGLIFGAYDFIFDDEGRYIFLEVNSLGQWLWLEEFADVAITAAVADKLITLANTV